MPVPLYDRDALAQPEDTNVFGKGRRHGRYCGWGHTCGDWFAPECAPVDEIDALCRRHDIRYSGYDTQRVEPALAAADARAIIEAEALLDRVDEVAPEYRELFRRRVVKLHGALLDAWTWHAGHGYPWDDYYRAEMEQDALNAYPVVPHPAERDDTAAEEGGEPEPAPSPSPRPERGSAAVPPRRRRRSALWELLALVGIASPDEEDPLEEAEEIVTREECAWEE